MNWQNYLRGLLISTLIFGGILIFLNLATSPESGMLTVVIYLVAVFFFVMGLASIMGFLLRRWWNHNEVLFENVKISLRQGFLMAGFADSLLTMRAFRVLNLIDGVILAITFILIEMYFKTRD